MAHNHSRESLPLSHSPHHTVPPAVHELPSLPSLLPSSLISLLCFSTSLSRLQQQAMMAMNGVVHDLTSPVAVSACCFPFQFVPTCLHVLPYFLCRTRQCQHPQQHQQRGELISHFLATPCVNTIDITGDFLPPFFPSFTSYP